MPGPWVERGDVPDGVAGGDIEDNAILEIALHDGSGNEQGTGLVHVLRSDAKGANKFFECRVITCSDACCWHWLVVVRIQRFTMLALSA